MDLATCTENLTFLPYAKVQLRGNKGGFIQEKLEILCCGKKIHIKFFPLNRRTTDLQGVGFSLGKQAIGKDDDDVEARADKKTLAEAQFADLNPSNTDRVGRGKDVGVTCERFPLFSKSGGGRSLGEEAKTGQALRGSTSARVIQLQAEKDKSPSIGVKNRFLILSDSDSYGGGGCLDLFTGGDKIDFKNNTLHLDQTQNNDQEIRTLSQDLGQAQRRFKPDKRSGLEVQSCFKGVGHLDSSLQKGAVPLIMGRPEMFFERPILVGSQLNKSKSLPPLRDPAAIFDFSGCCGPAINSQLNKSKSLPPLRDPATIFDFCGCCGTAINSQSIPTEASFSNAISGSVLETNRVRFKGRLKHLQPKQKKDFLKGCICRWEDFMKSEGKLKYLKNKVSVLKSNEQDSDREEVEAKTVLKVYARNRDKRFPRDNLETEMNQMGMEEVQVVQEGLESDFEGNKQLNLRSDSSSTSSFSDSDETFLTNRVTEEDFDMQLQGISSLMDDSEPTADKNRQDSVHFDLPSLHTSRMNMPQLDGEVEEGKNNNPLVDINGEWKNVQPLLTDMGLQLIPAPKEKILPRNNFKPRRKRGTRELQNLEFKVNYNRNDCSKGKSSHP